MNAWVAEYVLLCLIFYDVADKVVGYVVIVVAEDATAQAGSSDIATSALFLRLSGWELRDVRVIAEGRFGEGRVRRRNDSAGSERGVIACQSASRTMSIGGRDDRSAYVKRVEEER